MVKTHLRDPIGAAEGRWRSETSKIVRTSEVLKPARELLEVPARAEQLAVMTQAMGTEFEPARAKLIHPSPVYLVLLKRKIPRGTEPKALFDVSHRFHTIKSGGTLDVVGQDNAAIVAVGPESNVPAVLN